MRDLSMIRIFMTLCSLTPAFCQISQDRPELCGDRSRYTAVPLNISATINESNGSAVLSMGPEHAIELQGVNEDILEVCPLASNKMVAFGSTGVGYQVNIIDTLHYAVADSFSASDPAMSPDQHWIAYRQFYPPQSEINISEEYLLYDLNASASANRHNLTPYTIDSIGWAMYPALPGGAPVDRGDIPESKRHEWRSKSFFWGPDSRSVVFADSVGKNLSLVVVLVASDKPQAYTHAVSTVEICDGAASEEPYFTLDNASVTSDSGGGPGVVASFNDSSGSACQPRQLNLNFGDFKPARVEMYEHRKLKPAVPKRKDQ